LPVYGSSPFSYAFADALALLLVIARKDGFKPAAIRWHGRFEVETRGVGFAATTIPLAAPAGLVACDHTARPDGGLIHEYDAA
jgi:hypothetical protein